MAIQLSTAARNGRLDAIETELGASTIMKMRTGAQPANCAAADTGTVVATLNLPADAMANAAGGTKAKSGTWEDITADAAGTIGHFRWYKSDGVTCVMQGSVGVGAGDMQVDNNVVNAGQKVTVTGFTITDGNA